MITLFLGLIFFFLLPPSYIQNSAVSAVIGAPEKTEHLGFDLNQLKFAVGEPRFIFGLLGAIALLVLPRLRRTDTTALLLGWTIPFVILILRPDLVQIDLPSGRVANYLIFPLALLSAFLLALFFGALKNEKFLPKSVRIGAIILLFAFVLHNGFFNNDQYLLSQKNENNQKMLALFNGSRFLAERLPEEGLVVHDHINILGDSWIKLAFMRDYNYPFYRALLFRYDRPSDRQERCTLNVIGAPNSDEALGCMRDLGIRATFVNQSIDGEQFSHFNTYWQVYNDPFYSAYWYQPDKNFTFK